MSNHVRHALLGLLGALSVGFLALVLGSSAQAAPVTSVATVEVPTACATGTCCTCARATARTSKKKAVVLVSQSTQDAASGRYAFVVQVTPRQAKGRWWKYRVQQLVTVDGVESWMTLGTHRTRGGTSLTSHVVPAGTYRVVVLGTKSCKGRTYSARIHEPGTPATSNAGSATATGSSSGTGSSITNIYITAPAGTGTGTTNPTAPPASPTVVVGPPNAPTAVTATFRAPLTAHITWTPPVDNGGSTITSYKVVDTVYGLSCQAAPPATSCAVTGLVAGNTYAFTVMAMNAHGWSAASAASNAIVAISAPGAPTTVSALRADGAATVTWLAPVFTGGASISGYTVTSSSGASCTTNGALTCTFSGLANATAYTFFVQAQNSVGLSEQSAGFTLAAARVPGGVTDLSAAATGNSVTVTWKTPLSDGGLAPLTYHVKIGTQEFTTTELGWTGTLAIGSYSATVWASNPVGPGNRQTSGGFEIS